jgi:hypothetical protein
MPAVVTPIVVTSSAVAGAAAAQLQSAELGVAAVKLQPEELGVVVAVGSRSVTKRCCG